MSVAPIASKIGCAGRIGPSQTAAETSADGAVEENTAEQKEAGDTTNAD